MGGKRDEKGRSGMRVGEREKKGGGGDEEDLQNILFLSLFFY